MADTYQSDLPLFDKLGLEPFEGIEHNEHEVGRVAVGTDGSYVDVFVSCYPAQFWRFLMYRADTKDTIEMRTGSGALADYWPGAYQMARGMANVEYLEHQPDREGPAVLAVVPAGPRSRLSPLA